MNEKIQAILLRIIIDLKSLGWAAAPDWEITLKSEGHLPMIKNIPVENNIGELEIKDDVQTYVDLKLKSEDEITYFPEYNIYATIFIEGAGGKDVVHKMDADVAFTEKDVKDKGKTSLAAKKISRLVETQISQEFEEFINSHQQDITMAKQGETDMDDRGFRS